VKSEGDFAEILSQENPDIWRSNKPAQGGETGAMFDKIIAQAMQMRAGARESGHGARDSGLGVRDSKKSKSARTTTAKKKPAAKNTSTRSAGPKPKR
jgi:hypothetical protein